MFKVLHLKLGPYFSVLGLGSPVCPHSYATERTPCHPFQCLSRNQIVSLSSPPLYPLSPLPLYSPAPSPFAVPSTPHLTKVGGVLASPVPPPFQRWGVFCTPHLLWWRRPCYYYSQVISGKGRSF